MPPGLRGQGPGGGKIKGKPSSGGKIPAAKPSSRPAPRRRDDDDDDEYEHDRVEEYDEDDYEPPGRGRRSGSGGGGASGIAVVGLIFGVIAFCCPVTGIPLGILAMVFGGIGKRSPGGRVIGTAATSSGRSRS